MSVLQNRKLRARIQPVHYLNLRNRAHMYQHLMHADSAHQKLSKCSRESLSFVCLFTFTDKATEAQSSEVTCHSNSAGQKQFLSHCRDEVPLVSRIFFG